jgi:hypothetical protein
VPVRKIATARKLTKTGGDLLFCDGRQIISGADNRMNFFAIPATIKQSLSVKILSSHTK